MPNHNLTTYEYGKAVEFLPDKLLVRPWEGHDIRIETSRLEITPLHEIKWHRDVHDNCVAVVNYLECNTLLTFLSEIILENYQDSPFDFLIEPGAVNFPFQYDVMEATDLMPDQMPLFPEDSQTLRKWISRFWHLGQRLETYVLLDNINKAVAEQIEYRVREEPGVQSPKETLNQRTGSCRDMGQLMHGRRSTCLVPTGKDLTQPVGK